MIDEESKNDFLEKLSRSGNISISAKGANINKATIYRWRDSDSEFKEKMRRAEIEGRTYGCDAVEGILFSKAMHGEPWAVRHYLDHNSPRYMRPMLPRIRKFEDEYPGKGLLRLEEADEIKKECEDSGFGIPTYPDGRLGEIKEVELPKHKNYIREWIKKILDLRDN